MNIATSSLVIFLIATPAIISRRVYFTKELSKEYVSKNTLQEIFSSIFLCCILHFVWIIFVYLLGYKVNFETLFYLLFNPQKISDYSSITNYKLNIAAYFFSLIIVSTLISYLVRNLIRNLKWDRKFESLRYDNNWYYIFSGEILDIKKYSEDDSSNKIGVINIDVLTNSGSTEILYMGNLIDFKLKRDSVDYIVLSNPRKKIGTNPATTIKSNFFIIPYIEILNMNLRYFEAIEITENS